MRRAAAAIGAVAIAATLAAGCGSSGSSAEKDEATTTTTEAPSTTTTKAYAGPTEAELDAMLLTAADMGPDWTLEPSTGSDDDSSSDCLSQLKTKGIISDPRVDARFDYGNGAAYAFEGLTWAGDDPDATFDAAVEHIDSCTDVNLGSSDEPATLTPYTLPTMGDQSAAWNITFTANGTTVVADLVVATQGDIFVMALDGLAAGAVPEDGTTQFVQGAVAKVAKVQAG